MWIFTSDGFVSVVADRGDDSRLLVRARREGDVDGFLAPALDYQVSKTFKVLVTPEGDYRYRAFVDRQVVVRAISFWLSSLRYDNFKNSISDDRLHNACSRIWGVMYQLQLDENPSVPFATPSGPYLDLAEPVDSVEVDVCPDHQFENHGEYCGACGFDPSLGAAVLDEDDGYPD